MKSKVSVGLVLSVPPELSSIHFYKSFLNFLFNFLVPAIKLRTWCLPGGPRVLSCVLAPPFPSRHCKMPPPGQRRGCPPEPRLPRFLPLGECPLGLVTTSVQQGVFVGTSSPWHRPGASEQRALPSELGLHGGQGPG